MSPMLAARALLLVGLVAGPAAAQPLTLEALAGRWESPGVETIAGVRPTYLVRRFTFDGDRWSIRFTTYADSDGRDALLEGSNAGTVRLLPGLTAGGAQPADFRFATRTLTPLTRAIAAALVAAGCGPAPWPVGEARDVGARGCLAFRVPSLADCPVEFDVLRREGDALFLGARPATGDLCAPERRPDGVGDAPLRR
jgi:hypothetical protein